MVWGLAPRWLMSRSVKNAWRVGASVVTACLRTDRRGELPLGQPYTPQNVLATIYHVLGIDPATTLPDHQGRPIYLLDDRRKVTEVV